MQALQYEPGAGVTELLLKCHQLEKELASAADLTVDEFHCLVQLYVHAPCCVRSLREILGVNPTRTSKLLHDLEERGYLVRSLGYDDKRKELLALTERGLSTARSILQSSALSARRVLRELPEEVIRLLDEPPNPRGKAPEKN
ncbi:MAG: MarR family winged helix-turn-helix transcriptional regulator [Bacteroidota bacterium]